MLLLVRSSEVHVDLELHLVARVAAIEDRRASLAVGERVAGREIEPVLELDVDPVDRHLAPGEEDAGGLEVGDDPRRSEEHTSELQSRSDLVCRLLLEKKKNYNIV